MLSGTPVVLRLMGYEIHAFKLLAENWWCHSRSFFLFFVSAFKKEFWFAEELLANKLFTIWIAHEDKRKWNAQRGRLGQVF